ncbi:hypothetical protein EX30DRAFT_374025 [Ascodesmis nigricans]|uniref:Uncharacterized protein n=1 Tax=Ascodesmis nigricans TaxID=341454 RepID=A0A4S2MR73_9PEZI|nr:hypothetical protein EX30DRAFT_374025 [Ascodesmis nigricans]
MIEMPKVPSVPSAATDPIVRVPRPKARLQSTHSDTALMTFINGHHKPTHRYHSSIHGSSPYNIPTVGHTGHTFGEHEGSHKVQHTKHDGTSSAPPASSPRHRRHKSEHDSPAPMTYLAIPMASNPSQSSMITPLELTPRPSAPARPTINRTSSGRIHTGLSVITDNSYNPYPATFNHFAPEPLLLSGPEDQYIMSANLDPSATSGWPSFTPQYENFDMFDASNPLFNSTAFCDEVRGYSMYNSVPIARTNASSDEFDPDYRNTSPPSLVSQALSNADSEDYAAFSAHSSYIDLPRLADVSEERTMSSVPEEPEQSILTTRQHRNPFTQGYIPPVTATPATTPTGENVFNPFAVMYDNRAPLKGINDRTTELINLGAMTGLDAMGLGALGVLGGMGGLEMGMQGMGMGGLEGVRGSGEGAVRQQEEFLYMGWG